MSKPVLLSALARSILAGDPDPDQIAARCSRTLGRNWRWLKPLVRRYANAFAANRRPRAREVVAFLQKDEGLQSAWEKNSQELTIANWLRDSQPMRPVPAAANWPIPAIESVAALAAWLNLTQSELEWFADLKGLASKPGSDSRLGHYHYRTLAKSSGAIRLVEAPKSRLKEIQRLVLTEVLDQIPTHPAAHGFVRGRSIQTFAAPHVARSVVLRLDLEDFFPTFPARRIQAIFRTSGYPESVADLLGGLCTNSARRDIWKHLAPIPDIGLLQEARSLYSRPHLPQGAPTSPALANICAYRIDCRLTGLAQSAGATYTRYADDLAFSGDAAFESCVERFALHAAAILTDEGFRINHRKTRIMRQGVRQYLAGLVTNQRINVPRADYDQLKATLHNCIRHGPESQNRASHPNFRLHLAGRVAFVESVNPAKGAQLRKFLEQISW